jgi:hypothetical protein
MSDIRISLCHEMCKGLVMSDDQQSVRVVPSAGMFGQFIGSKACLGTPFALARARLFTLTMEPFRSLA